MPSKTACPHCGSALVRPLFVNTDYISGESFTVAQCGGCGVAWTERPDALTDLSRYYGDAYYGKKGSRFPAPLEALVRWFRQRRVDAMTRGFDSPGTALDIGCGRALTLNLLKRQGWRCVGTEYSQELADAARTTYDIPVHVQPSLAECRFSTESFDLVSVYHVLEHVENPFVTLAEIRRILKTDGVLHVEVPNLNSAQARVGRGRWFHLDTPRHLWHFDTRTLENLLRQSGFEILSQGTHSLEYGYYGLWQTLLNRITPGMNVAYGLLKRKPAPAGDILLTLLGALPAALVAIPVEWVASLLGRGSVCRFVARPAIDGRE
jgi:2-polyprenyl-3-methyl-5-hydroxy-6-metoxy-1,4-benzoquinol methylase